MNTAAPSRKKNRLRQLWRGVGLSVLLVAAFQIWCAWQVYGYARPHAESAEPADAAIVLGAAAWGSRPSPVFRERINHAIALYQSGRVGKLVFTGGSRTAGFPSEGEVARRWAVKQGVPDADIIFETRSKDTFQNLANARFLMRRHGLDSAIIVSDPYHMARAMAIARDFGIKAQPSPTPTSRYTEASEEARLKFFVQESYALFVYRLLWVAKRVQGWIMGEEASLDG